MHLQTSISPIRTLLALATLFCLSSISVAQTYEWSQQLRGPHGDLAYEMLVTDDGSVLTFGTFQDSMDADPGPNVTLLRNDNPDRTAVFIQKSDVSGNFLWAKQLSGPTGNLVGVQVHSVCTNAAGDIYMAGDFVGAIDFDPGPNVHTASFSTQDGGYILKLNANGEFIWVNCMTVSDIGFNSMAIDNLGNLYIGGGFKGAFDADPGPGISFLSYDGSITGGGGDMFILKWTEAGTFVWAKKMGSPRNDLVSRMGISKDGNLIAVGHFMWTVDFDPSTQGVAKLTASNDNLDCFILQFSPAGEFMWVKQFTGSGVKLARGLQIDNNGNILFGGLFSGTIDLDPGPLVLQESSMNDNIFLVKLDAAGDLLWGRNIGGNGTESITAMDVDELGNVYAVGYFDKTTDFDPGPNVVTLTAPTAGVKNSFVLKTDFLGQVIWARAIQGQSIPYGLDVSKNGNIHIAGYFSNTLTVNPGSNPVIYTTPGDYDVYILKLSQGWHFAGNVFFDANANGIRDAGETGLKGFNFQARQKDQYAVSNLQGDFHFYDNLVGDTVVAVPPWAGWTLQPAFIIPNANGAVLTFAAQNPLGSKDVGITAIEATKFRPGVLTDVIIQVTNEGNFPFYDVPVQLTLENPTTPGWVNFDHAFPNPVSQTSQVFQWNIAELLPYQTKTFKTFFKTSTVVPANTPVVMSAVVVLADDVNPSNNESRIETHVFASLDPNDKQVTPSNVVPASIDTTDLRYVIRFQNTGNYPTDFVVIRDTLPSELDLSTLKVLATSHPCSWRLFGARELEFRFDPVHLPDSTSNEPESHGFVAFSVKAKANTPAGTFIHNRAGIYFDYNPAVMTNTADMHVGDVVQVTDPMGKNGLEFGLSPNPVAAFSRTVVELPTANFDKTTVTVFNALGQKSREITAEKGARQVWLDGLTSGSYFVQVRSGKLQGGKVLIAQ